MDKYEYYIQIVKHLIIVNGYYEQYAWNTACEWDYYPKQNDDLFLYEMCRLYRIL